MLLIKKTIRVSLLSCGQLCGKPGKAWKLTDLSDGLFSISPTLGEELINEQNQ